MTAALQKITKNPWWIVVGSLIALITSSGAVLLFGFSLFIEPLTKEFGWSRSAISAGYSASALSSALAYPWTGYLVDRIGLKRSTMIMIVLFGSAMAGISLTNSSPISFWVLYAIAGACGTGHSSLQYAKSISAWFERSRGLALGIAMAGIGIGAILVPQIVRLLIELYGWRLAYVGTGIFIIVVALPACGLLVRDPPAEEINRHGSSAIVELPGFTASEALRDTTFWITAIAVFLIGMALNGAISHSVPLLVDRGVSPRVAASMLIAVGIGSVTGRVLCGWIFDHIFAPYVSAAAFGISALGCALLAYAHSPAVALFALASFGFGFGAEVNMIGFLIGRYFGLKRYGTIYGYIFMVFSVGNASGTYILGLLFDVTHSYHLGLMAFAAALLISVALMLCLGPYRFGHNQHLR